MVKLRLSAEQMRAKEEKKVERKINKHHSAFKTIKKGSTILTAFLEYHNKIAISIPKKVPINSAINVSNKE